MTRQWNLFGKLVNRTALGLMAAGAMVAAAALYTPIAQASPQSDATDADTNAEGATAPAQ